MSDRFGCRDSDPSSRLGTRRAESTATRVEALAEQAERAAKSLEKFARWARLAPGTLSRPEVEKLEVGMPKLVEIARVLESNTSGKTPDN